MEKNFIDYIRVFCRSGHGGAGIKHFMRNKLTAMGGPDGGDGGRGAHIILRGNSQLWTLLHLRYYKNVLADDGDPGGKNNMTGKDGKDIIIEVPLGTIARDEVTGEVKAEILEHGQQVILMKGGRGGLGNANFATPTNQAPEHAQPGEPGVEGWMQLELKVLADVGLVGFPNAGKSTLLNALLNEEKAIVSDIAGTTRDFIEDEISIGGVIFRFIDTAGLRETTDKVEAIGVERTMQKLSQSSLIIYLFDITEYSPEEVQEEMEKLKLSYPLIK